MYLRAVPDLGELAALFFVLGCIYVVDAFVRAMFGTVTGVVGWIPFVGKVVTAPVEKIEQKVTNALGAAEATIDREIGKVWHNLANTIITLVELLIALPVLIYDLGKLVGEALARTHTNTEATHVASAVAAAATAEATHGLDRVRVAEREALHGIDTLSGRIGLIEQEIAGTLAPEVEALRDRAHAIEDGYERAWELLRKHEADLGIAALTGAVAVALEELGSSWIRCETNKLVGRKLCGSNFSVLRALLEGALGAFTITELCNLTKLLVKVADSGPVQDSLTFVTHGLTDLFKCQGVKRPRAYKLPAPDVAPKLGYAALTPPSV